VIDLFAAEVSSSEYAGAVRERASHGGASGSPCAFSSSNRTCYPVNRCVDGPVVKRRLRFSSTRLAERTRRSALIRLVFAQPVKCSVSLDTASCSSAGPKALAPPIKRAAIRLVAYLRAFVNEARQIGLDIFQNLVVPTQPPHNWAGRKRTAGIAPGAKGALLDRAPRLKQLAIQRPGSGF